MACMSVCDPDEGMHAHFKGWLPEQFIADLPRDEKSTASLDTLMQNQREQIAGVIIEPLVQGVGGMKFHDPAVLRRVAELCKTHNVLLIADEVFTGFGRTGTLFACEQAAVVPDMLCLGKALSAATVTLAAVLASEHVFEAFYSDDPHKAFMNGPTYMANPLACAAANASLDLFEREPRLEQAHAMEKTLLQGLAPCRYLPGVIDVRAKGAIGVVQMNVPLDHQKIRQHFIAQGVWARSWGDHFYLTPALNIPADELQALMKAVCETVKTL
jgi:adenosylmethionine-8-amino-7-oxononanoate aminotransferase